MPRSSAERKRRNVGGSPAKSMPSVMTKTARQANAVKALSPRGSTAQMRLAISVLRV